MVKTISIEALVAWAFRDELPKAEAPAPATVAARSTGYGEGWGAVSAYGELMPETVGDGRVGRFGVVPLGTHFGEPPHPDAFTVHRLWKDLGKFELDIPAGWSPLAGLRLSPEEEADAVRRAMPRLAMPLGEGRWRMRIKAAELVRRYAILGGTPDWHFPVPKARFVSAYGKPLWFRKALVQAIGGRMVEQEVDGYNARAKRPWAGAYRKTILEPDPALAVGQRADYEVWHAALCALADELRADGVLSAHRVDPPQAPARPWE